MGTFNIKNILVPVDFSETSSKAVDVAINVAQKTKATITLLHVVEPEITTTAWGEFGMVTSPHITSFEKELLQTKKEHLEKWASDKAKKNQVNMKPLTEPGWVLGEILNAVKKTKTDLIIMGTHGVKGFREFVMGSNTFRVVNEATCPVLSVRKDFKPGGFKNILLPFRDRPHSREKVDYAIEMATLFGSTIHVLGIDIEQTGEDLKKIELEAEQVKKIIEHRGITCTVKVEQGVYVSNKILDYAKLNHADLVVIMSDLDKSSISEFFMGPFAQQVVNHSSIPVLSIRPAYNPVMEEIYVPGFNWQ